MKYHETRCFVAFGSNMPLGSASSRQIVDDAVARLRAWGDVEISAFYRSLAFPVGSGPDFVNAVAAVKTDVTSSEVMNALHAIEADFGRERSGRWGPRTLDLDLLAHGDSVLPDPMTQDRWRETPQSAQLEVAPDQLILPHPRLQYRAFVLRPWADLAPDWRHPRTGRTVAQMLAALPAAERASVWPVKPA